MIRFLSRPDRKRIAAAYRHFLDPMWPEDGEEPNITSYQALYSSPEGVRKLTEAFEIFVRSWNGNLHDVHLSFQSTWFADARGRMMPPMETWHLRDANRMYKRMGLNPKEIARGRSYPRRFNVSAISDETRVRMCNLLMLDYCCLNLELPPFCQGHTMKCRRRTDGRIEPELTISQFYRLHQQVK